MIFVLSGLFGMHGLAAHGTDTTEMGMSAMVAEAPTALAAAIQPGEPPVEEKTRRDATSRAMPLPTVAMPGVVGVISGAMWQGAMSGGAMAMLCLAVLTVAAALLLLSARRPRVGLSRLRTLAPFAMPSVGRDRDPPSLIALSIRRC